MIRKFVTLMLCLLPVAIWGQVEQHHQHEENHNTGLGGGEIFSPFRNNPKDSTKSELKVPKEIRQWHVDEHSGKIIPVNADTLQFMFQNWHMTEGMNGEYNYLGNFGTPRQSRIFFNRPTDTKFDFLQPYDYFYLRPTNFFFVDTKSPYTNLSYHSSGNRMTGDDRVRAYFSTNAGKKFGIGFLIDYLYARGRYDKQATSLANFSLFSFYKSDHYDYNLLASHYRMKQAENGGITDDRYITRPEETDGMNSSFTTSDIPVRLNSSWNRNGIFDAFFTHGYNMGFYRDKMVADSSGVVKDSIQSEFIRVARISHTADVKYHEHEFINYRQPQNYYADEFLPNDSTDLTTSLKVKNRIAFSLCEGFSRYAFADIEAFASHTYRRYRLPDTTAVSQTEYIKDYNEHIVSVGGSISSTKNNILKYNVYGETALFGEELGTFSIDGDIEFNFNILKRDMQLKAKAFIKNNLPSFYYRHYHSEHFWWDNDLNKEFKTRIEGSFEIPSWRTKISAGLENVKNYTYIANESLPTGAAGRYLWRLNVRQDNSNIQIFSASLKQDFKFGIFNLNTEVTYQHSSNDDVLPLPMINAYVNLFLKFRIAKVLHTEIGADTRYFTKYYAPDYSPALGQFVQQNPEDKVAIGNYPLVNVYANFLLKQARFYVKYYHLNEGAGNRQYFLAPHYPMTPRTLWFGISWNFFN